MKRLLVLTAFVLATLTWASAQSSSPQSGSQGSSTATQSTSQGSQGTSPGSQAGTSSAQTPSSGAAGQTGAQSSPTGAGSAPITQGCLGGSKGAYTITDAAGKSYKLNIPATADSTPLGSHIGESVMVMGNVNNSGSPSIDVQQIGRGTGTCPGKSSAAPQAH